MLGDEAMKLEECGLRAGVHPVATRADHDVLEEHAVVEPAALPQHAVDREDQADRRTEERIVAPMLRMHAGLVGLVDPEQAVQVPAHFAAPIDVGGTPLGGVVGVFLGVQCALRRVIVDGQNLL